ncbi:MAG: hypothetical protein ACTHJ2_10695 [Candidatus Nitrosocosmicus sp.]
MKQFKVGQRIDIYKIVDDLNYFSFKSQIGEFRPGLDAFFGGAFIYANMKTIENSTLYFSSGYKKVGTMIIKSIKQQSTKP